MLLNCQFQCGKFLFCKFFLIHFKSARSIKTRRMKNSHRTPFDYKNPIGYSIAVALQLRFAVIPLRYIQCFLTLGFAGLLFSFSIVKDLNHSLKLFNRMASKKAKTKQNQSELMDALFELIRFTNLRELSSSKFNFFYTTIVSIN